MCVFLLFIYKTKEFFKLFLTYLFLLHQMLDEVEVRAIKEAVQKTFLLMLLIIPSAEGCNIAEKVTSYRLMSDETHLLQSADKGADGVEMCARFGQHIIKLSHGEAIRILP